MDRLMGCLSTSLIMALLLLSACQTAPVTGRSQLILIPESMEMELGLTAYKDALPT